MELKLKGFKIKFLFTVIYRGSCSGH